MKESLVDAKRAIVTTFLSLTVAAPTLTGHPPRPRQNRFVYRQTYSAPAPTSASEHAPFPRRAPQQGIQGRGWRIHWGGCMRPGPLGVPHT